MLNPKRRGICHAWIKTRNPDIICICETWLSSDIADSEILPDKYTIYRKDRPNNRHGGVILAVNSELNSTRVTDFDTDAEVVWCSLLVSDKCDEYDDILLLGDFNLQMTWGDVPLPLNDCSSSVCNAFSYNGNILTTASDICNAFSENFKLNFSKPVAATPDLCRPTDPRVNSLIDNIVCSPDVVRKNLLLIKPDAAAGPDGVPARVLHNCASSISNSICALFNFSLDSGAVPDAWKEAKVFPVYKSGSKSDLSNYRPISLTSLVSKCLERIVVEKLHSHLNSNNLISREQHGFLPRRKTWELCKQQKIQGTCLTGGGGEVLGFGSSRPVKIRVRFRTVFEFACLRVHGILYVAESDVRTLLSRDAAVSMELIRFTTMQTSGSQNTMVRCPSGASNPAVRLGYTRVVCDDSLPNQLHNTMDPFTDTIYCSSKYDTPQASSSNT
ncbi:hypothetical protein B566_EDAN008036 [Ephemera danica]|nr:hypothetical protein B566_EDAN008036 [Ephemera danica]